MALEPGALPGSYDGTAALVTETGAGECSRPGAMSAKSPTVAQLEEEVGRLVGRHHSELMNCFDSWLQAQRAPELRLEARAGLGSEQPTGAPQPDLGAVAPQLLTSREKKLGLDRQLTRLSDGVPKSLRSSSSGHWQLSQGVLPNECKPETAAVQQGEGSDRTLDGNPRNHILNLPSSRQKKKRKEKHRSTTVFMSTSSGSKMYEDPSWLERVTESRWYEAGSGLLIFLNTCFIGWLTQFVALQAEANAAAGKALSTSLPDSFLVVQVIFAVLFLIELSLRWMCRGLFDFFRGYDMWWNILDAMVVTIGLGDIALTAIGRGNMEESFLGSVQILRVLRIVRLVRVVRVIRTMPFFRELRLMVFSILGSAKSLLWVVLVLLVVFFVFGITFTAATTAYLERSASPMGPETENLRMYFGTVDRSVLSLYMAMSGGNDWGQYYDALSYLPVHYRMLFLIFITLAVFAVVNIVTGVFVESAMQSNSTDKEIVVFEELQAKKVYLQSMKEVFDEMDRDNTGCVTMEEFERKLDDERVIAYFNALKLDVSDGHIIFRLLDYDQSGTVNIDEFLKGCYSLQGESRSLDMKIMQYEVRFLQESFVVFSDALKRLEAGLLGAPGAEAGD